MPGAEVAPVTYRVVLERDESGSWIARVPAVPGCHTHGRSLVEARRRIREALSLWVDDSDRADLIDDVQLPRDALAAVSKSRRSRARLTTARANAAASTAEAVSYLVDELDLSVRDAAYMLGLSFQRVQQVAGPARDAGPTG
jgi:predicted RNase H-like HicB family nuclease